jgi:hypothetical protein
VSDKVAQAGLPRPLCVMAGSNGVYPYFDAPVTGMPVEVLKAAAAEEDDVNPLDTGVPGPRYSSLLMTGIKRAPKRAVLVLEESKEDMAIRIANLRGLAHGHQEAEAAPPPAPADQPEIHAEQPGTEGIIDLPISPLMTKKPHGPGWDFRDMLSPREPGFPGEPAAEPHFEPAANFADWNEPEPELEPGPEAGPESLPDDRDEPEIAEDPAGFEPAGEEPLELVASLPRDEPVEPGFSLVEVSLQERLESLLASPVVAAPPAIEIELEAEPEPESEPEAEPEAIAAADPTPPIPQVTVPDWPLGLGWLEDFEPAGTAIASAEDPHSAELQPGAPRIGLWQRLLTLLRSSRRSAPSSRMRKLHP